MRTGNVIALFLALISAAPTKVTVADLEQIVAHVRSQPDKEAARQISEMTIDERISAKRFETLDAEVPGERSRAALMILHDLSEFLDLPGDDMPNLPAPPMEEQRRITVKAVQFAADTLHRMPNFIATRNAQQYQSMGPEKQILVLGGMRQYVATTGQAQPFKQIGSSQRTVVYRDGKEVLEEKGPSTKLPRYGVESRGEFGEFLKLVVGDMVHSQIRWSHWERGSAGLLAVFSFEVRKEQASYRWTFCCVRSREGGARILRDPAPYRAEIAIDPASGSIFRIAVRTEPSTEPILKASEMVEYGPVKIGGSVYFCPLRNVVLYSVRVRKGLGSPEKYAVSPQSEARFVFESDSIVISHTMFENYHVFKSTMRIVPNDVQEVPVKP